MNCRHADQENKIFVAAKQFVPLGRLNGAAISPRGVKQMSYSRNDKAFVRTKKTWR